MKNKIAPARTTEDKSVNDPARGLPGAQTLIRGLEIIDAVADRVVSLGDLAERLQLTRSTTHRLASTLVKHRYLDFRRGSGYSLGSRLLELGYLVAGQLTLTRVARPHLEDLAGRTSDTVYLAVLDGERALYMDKVQGTRRLDVSSRIGARQPLRSTGLGKALILDASEARWREYYDYEARMGHGYEVTLEEWLARMKVYAKAGCAFDLGESDDCIRCVAAPVRDVSGAIVGAISISSASPYMDDLRMRGLSIEVKKTAALISRELGHNPGSRPQLHVVPAAPRRVRQTRPRKVANG